MSNYRCWVSDFPKRCQKLLDKFEGQAKLNDLEVTLLLAVASASIGITHDRIKNTDSKSVKHLGSVHVNEKQSEKAKCLLKTKISDINAFRNGIVLYGRNAVRNPDPGSMPDDWNLNDSCKEISKNKEFGTIIKHVRNALAHGNIFTLSENGLIKNIVFLSRLYDHNENKSINEYDALIIAVHDLKEILKYWVDEVVAIGVGYQGIASYLDLEIEAA